MLLDQSEFECDPLNRAEGDTPLHTVIRWINSEPVAQRPFGNALVAMMLEAGSNARVRNRGRLTPLQLVSPDNTGLRELIQQHEYAAMNAGDFVDEEKGGKEETGAKGKTANKKEGVKVVEEDDGDEFSGSDEEDRAEWERSRKAKQR